MSKPKPGLGKGLVRTALAATHVHSSHTHPSLAGTASSFGALSLAPIVGHHVHLPKANSPTAAAAASSTLAAAATAGPPFPAGPAGPVSTHGGYLSLLPTWDNGDIVATYRQSTLRIPIPNPLKYITSSSAIAGPGPSSLRRYTTPTAPVRDASAHFSTPPSGPSIPPSVLFDISTFPKSFSSSSDSGGGGASTFSEFFSSPPPPPPPPPPPEGIGRTPTLKHPPRPSSTQTVLSPLPLHSSSSSSAFSITSYPYLAFPDLPPTADLAPSPDASSSLAHAYSSDLVFRYGASGLAKERIAPPPMSSTSSSGTRAATPPPRPRSFALPEVDPPKEMRSVGVGEDAYFARGDSMCVADGVGGWAKSGRGGADAGRWSRLLTHFCEGEVGAWWAGDSYYLEDVDSGVPETSARGASGDEGVSGWAGRLWKTSQATSGLGISGVEDHADRAGLPEGKKRRKLDPVEIMQRGFEKCLACVLAEGVHGSSTCLLALLHHNSLLVANLGDCCLLLIRRGEVVFRTSEMQHAFNFPLQLGTHSRDEPMKDAKRYEVGVEKEDVVVVGSDGLMDNLFDEDILDTLAEFSSPSFEYLPSLPTPPPSRPSSRDGLPPFNPQKVSEALCRKARSVSEQMTATTPFMVRAIEEGIDFVGGKKDDISVLVGVIGERRAEDGKGLTLHTYSR